MRTWNICINSRSDCILLRELAPDEIRLVQKAKRSSEKRMGFAHAGTGKHLLPRPAPGDMLIRDSTKVQDDHTFSEHLVYDVGSARNCLVHRLVDRELAEIFLVRNAPSDQAWKLTEVKHSDCLTVLSVDSIRGMRLNGYSSLLSALWDSYPSTDVHIAECMRPSPMIYKVLAPDGSIKDVLL